MQNIWRKKDMKIEIRECECEKLSDTHHGGGGRVYSPGGIME